MQTTKAIEKKKGNSTKPKLWGIFHRPTKTLLAFSYSQRQARKMRMNEINMGLYSSKEITAPTKFRYTLIIK